MTTIKRLVGEIPARDVAVREFVDAVVDGLPADTRQAVVDRLVEAINSHLPLGTRLLPSGLVMARPGAYVSLRDFKNVLRVVVTEEHIRRLAGLLED